MKPLVLSTEDQNVFFTSDTHFYHINILKFCNRPFADVNEMNDVLIKNWNEVVGPNDIVFHLGDFAFCGSNECKNLVEKLNGRKYLIVGNHDWKTIKQGYADKFDDIQQQMTIKVDGQGIYLNHYPFLCYAGPYNKDKVWQLFGHVHSNPNFNTGLDKPRLSMLFPTQYDVGVDNNNYRPVSFAEVKEIIKKQIAESASTKS